MISSYSTSWRRGLRSMNTIYRRLSQWPPTGFKVTNSGCCGGQKGCLPLATPCKNRDEYTFWDEFHPTDAMNVIFANRAYKALTPTDAHPIDISTLASL